MPKSPRIDIANYIYHVINRSNAKAKIFKSKKDFQAFEKVLTEAKEKFDMRILVYCIMSNHWHLVLKPKKDGDLARFIGWLTLTHTQRWHVFHESVGEGHLYQGRYKSFIVQKEEHFLQLCRYVEQNALRAGMVKKAQNWPWSSLYRRKYGTDKEKKILSNWPTGVPNNYLKWVNTKIKNKETEAIKYSITRGKPYGDELWTNRIIKRLGLETTTRQRGRPKTK